MSFKKRNPVQWGNVILSDLASGVTMQDFGHGPRQLPALCHEPTQLIVAKDLRIQQDRGQGPRGYVFHLLGNTHQALKVVTSHADKGVFVGTRVYLEAIGIDGSDLSSEKLRLAENEYLHRSGMKFRCDSVGPERGLKPIHFTYELRDAALRLLCFELAGNYAMQTDPFPIQVDFQSEGIPKEIHGTQSNPYHEASL